MKGGTEGGWNDRRLKKRFGGSLGRAHTFFSVRITIPSNWSSNPFIVTVKSIIDVLALTSGVYAGLPSFVVMYNVNSFITSTSLSPTITLKVLPDLMKFFSSTLSSAGSSSSPTSSIMSGRPRDSESSRCDRKYLWFSDVTWWIVEKPDVLKNHI